MSTELKLLLDAFIKSTGIKPDGTDENKYSFHWVRLLFNGLNSEQLMKISEFIRLNFSEPGKFSHNLPLLHSFDGTVALTFSRNEINKFLNK